MSKTLDLLKEAQAHKLNGSSLTIKGNQVKVNNKLAVKTSKAHTFWMMALVFLTLLLSNIGLTYRLFVITNNSKAERSVSFAKLDRMEELLKDNSRQLNSFAADMKQFSAELESVNVKITNSSAKIKAIEWINDVQSAAIDNLTKAKDKLFKDVSQLRAELDELSKL